MMDMMSVDFGIESLLDLCGQGLILAEQMLEAARRSVAGLVAAGGRTETGQLEAHQAAAHGFAWQATYVEALRQALRWGRDLREAGMLGPIETDMLRLGFAEYLAQLGGGIPISQAEMVRPADLGLSPELSAQLLCHPVLAELTAPAAMDGARRRLAAAAAGLSGETHA